MEMEALNRLSQVFVDATKKMSGIELEEPPTVQAPRVEEMEQAPRVEVVAEAPRVQTTVNKDLPNLIPADDSDNKSSDDESAEEEEDELYEPTPKYNTRAQAAKQKIFHSNVTQEAILSAIEMSFERLSQQN